MSLSYKGFNEQTLTFKAFQASKDYPVFINTQGEVTNCNANSEFAGICTSLRNGLATVQVSGYAELPYGDSVPSYGTTYLMADGSGGVKPSASGKKAYLIVSIDKVNKKIGFIMKKEELFTMAFDNIKLEKGLYATSKGFTASLEELDPSENYIGTELEGLDAYQRQLKRFGIKVSGEKSDSVMKFFNTTDSAALFPEYVSRAVKQGIEESDVLSSIVATTTVIDSLDYRSVESIPGNDEKELSEVAEGAFIPQTTVKTKERLTKLQKRGRMLVASYEAIKFQKLDLFTVMLKQIGAYIAKSQLNDAVISLIEDEEDFRTTSETALTYNHFIELWNSLQPYELSTVIAPSAYIMQMMNMSEFKDSNAGQTFHGTGKMITPLGAQIVRSEALPDFVIGLDKRFALEKIQAGDVITEYDKLIDRQLERATITSIAGFSRITNGSVKGIHFEAE